MTALPIDPSTLLSFLGDQAEPHLRTYFDSGTFTGGRFERFAGGGDRHEVANVIDSDDVVAVALLGVRIPGHPALSILEDRRAEISALLGDIPVGLDLWDAEEEAIMSGSAADRLWQLLVGLPGINWVTAGKLLARKRPQLIPVYDSVVKAALNRPGSDEWWLPLRAALIADPSVVARLEGLRTALGLDGISLIRILDVAIWMQEYGQPEPVPDAEE